MAYTFDKTSGHAVALTVESDVQGIDLLVKIEDCFLSEGTAASLTRRLKKEGELEQDAKGIKAGGFSM